MKTEEGNKLIAEFMGEGRNFGDEYYEAFCETTLDMGNNVWVTESISDMKYHESWDWLMPVVNKICSYDEAFDYFDVYIESMCCTIVPETSSEPVFEVSYSKAYKLTGVWNCCIQFIQWYNDYKQDSKKECKQKDKRRCTYPHCECMPTKFGD